MCPKNWKKRIERVKEKTIFINRQQRIARDDMETMDQSRLFNMMDRVSVILARAPNDINDGNEREKRTNNNNTTFQKKKKKKKKILC